VAALLGAVTAMAEARVILVRGGLVQRNARLSDRPDEWATFRRVFLPAAFGGVDIAVEHGTGRDDDVLIAWGEKKGRRMAVGPGEVVRLVGAGATLEVIHYAESIRFRP
jgi:hypothetical protein